MKDTSSTKSIDEQQIIEFHKTLFDDKINVVSAQVAKLLQKKQDLINNHNKGIVTIKALLLLWPRLSQQEVDLLQTVSDKSKQTVLDAILFKTDQSPVDETIVINTTKKKRPIMLIIATVVLTILISFSLYLFALNGRYENLGDTVVVFDKWKKECIVPNESNLKEI